MRWSIAEEVDITVQATENRDATDPAGDTTTFTRSTSRDSYFTFTQGTLTDRDPTGTRSTIELNDSRAVSRTPDTIGADDVEGVFNTRRNGTYRIGYTYVGTTAKTEDDHTREHRDQETVDQRPRWYDFAQRSH